MRTVFERFQPKKSEDPVHAYKRKTIFSWSKQVLEFPLFDISLHTDYRSLLVN